MPCQPSEVLHGPFCVSVDEDSQLGTVYGGGVHCQVSAEDITRLLPYWYSCSPYYDDVAMYKNRDFWSKVKVAANVSFGGIYMFSP